MVRRHCSRSARSLLLSVIFAASWGAARDASAMGRYGLLPVDSAHASAPASREPALGHFPGDTAAQCGVITYCGGPVLSSVQLVPVFWTHQVTSTITSWAPAYLQSLADSSFLDMLSEYSTKGKTGEACGMQTDAGLEYFGPPMPFSTNQTITRGTGLSAVIINPTMATGTSITDDNAAIGLELASQIAHSNLPAPTYDAQGYPNTLYVVFFPSSIRITLMGMQSCGAFGGYHYSAPYTAQASCKGQYLPYAVIPDCGGGTPDITVSHEVAEAVTDPDVGPTTPMPANYGDGAWYLGPSYPCTAPTNCPSNCGEVGDVCEGSGGQQVPGTSVNAQNVWSQSQNHCAVDNPNVSTQPTVPGGGTCTGSPPPPSPDAGSPTGSDAGATADSGPGSSGGDAGGLDDSGASSGGTGPGGDDASVGGGSGSSGGNGASGGGSPFNGPVSSAGCACTTAPADDWSGPGAVAAMLGLALLGARRSRRSSRARALTR